MRGSLSQVPFCRIRFGIITRWLKEFNKELTKETVEEFFYYLKQKGLNNNTLNTYVFTFRYIQDYLLDRGIDNNFFKGFSSFAKVKPAIIILTPDEIEKIINTPFTYGRFYKLSPEEVTKIIDYRYRTGSMFFAYTGCRFDEMASLKLKYLDLSAGKAMFIETKNKDIRFAHITEPLISRLKTLVEGKGQEDFVFTSITGKNFIPRTSSTTYIGEQKQPE